MKDAPAFDLYPQRWLAGTVSLTAEERGAYIQLLCEQWEQEGLPDDVKRLLAIARCRPAALVNILPKFPKCDDGKRRNSRLEVIREEQRVRIEKSRLKIEKMNAARVSCRGSTRTSTRESQNGPQETPCRPSSPLTTVLEATLPEGAPPPTDSSKQESYPQREGVDPPEAGATLTDLQQRLGALFGRRKSTQWDAKEIKQLRKISKTVSDADLQRLEWYYRLQIPKESDYRRQTLSTLLNNFTGELDRARKFKEPSHY
jgi:uncharacterized protein YdaU (DUF1376 family)